MGEEGDGEPGRAPGAAPGATPLRTLLLQAGAAVGAQLSLLAALLYYFGWVRSAARASYFGFAESHLAPSAQWYMLSSVPALYEPFLVASGTLLLWRIGDPLLVRTLTARPRARRLCCAGLVAALPAVPLALWAMTRLSPGWWELALPASLTAGVLLASYGCALWSRTSTGTGADPAWTLWPASMGLYAVGLVVVLVFWTVGAFASVEGRGSAMRMAATLEHHLGVVVYSAQDLRLSAPGVDVTFYPDRGAYHYRYQGLKFYAYANGKLFLLPRGWTYDRPQTIVLPDREGLRVEYVGP
ncbi:hypothetical protein [Streptomyces sp. MST-110588]|uniref:hypothetical protein n=1 Tax=Streptomyces sp. MST-110588 TaxID=2833628 RepID=UPI001F5D297F|nr:hypothetical protein [Streptomyces sp. MST-110588]UNO41446.1 hypothetical protein KGS77_20080 [Streptomyces sp. MST-110588]